MDDNPAGQFGYHTEDDVPGRTTVGAVALRLFPVLGRAKSLSFAARTLSGGGKST
jgi:hypothetical protein